MTMGCSTAVPKMTSEEVAHWRTMAEKGNAVAQYNLGFAYWNGEGVKKDQGEAVDWFRKAAWQGYADAQNYLGIAYAHGQGVIINLEKAYIWWSIAKASGNELAADNMGDENQWALMLCCEIDAIRKEAERRMEEIENGNK